MDRQDDRTRQQRQPKRRGEEQTEDGGLEPRVAIKQIPDQLWSNGVYAAEGPFPWEMRHPLRCKYHHETQGLTLQFSSAQESAVACVLLAGTLQMIAVWWAHSVESRAMCRRPESCSTMCLGTGTAPRLSKAS